MNRIIQRLSELSKTPPARVADEVESIVHDALKKIRAGQNASIPGLGEFVAGKELKFISEKRHVSKPTTSRKTSR